MLCLSTLHLLTPHFVSSALTSPQTFFLFFPPPISVPRLHHFVSAPTVPSVYSPSLLFHPQRSGSSIRSGSADLYYLSRAKKKRCPMKSSIDSDCAPPPTSSPPVSAVFLCLNVTCLSFTTERFFIFFKIAVTFGGKLMKKSTLPQLSTILLNQSFH